MTCRNCSSESTTTVVAPGADTSQARTVYIGAGKTEQIDASNTGRRTALVVNQSAGAIVVGFGSTPPIAGGGPGVTLLAGQSITVATTAEVQVHNPQAAQAQIAYVTEQD